MVAKTKPNGTGTKKLYAPKKVSLGCGQSKPEGYFGIDIVPVGGVDLVHDLWEFPWPIRTGVVTELHCSHLVEHIPHQHPGWEKDGWFLFFDEIHRICKKDAVCTFQHPYVMNGRAFWDPTHTRYIHETTWYYLSAEWRRSQALDHYPASHDFEVTAIEGMGVHPETISRHHEAQAFHRDRYWNTLADLMVLLRAIKE